MMMTKTTWIAASVLALSLGCSLEVTEYRNAITGESCEPDPETLSYEGPPAEGERPGEGIPPCFGNNGHGNNEDGVDSSNPGQGQGGPNGEIDESCDGSGECIDDEIRPPAGEGEDCYIPPGCDETGCCEDGFDDDGTDDDGTDDDGTDDDGTDDDGTDDDGTDDDGTDDDGSTDDPPVVN